MRLTIILTLFLLVSCSPIQPQNKVDITTDEVNIKERFDYYSPTLSEEEKNLLQGEVTLEILESIVGKLTFDYTPLKSSGQKTYVYKGTDQISYEIEFGRSQSENSGEIIACRIAEGEYDFIFCKTNSMLYLILELNDLKTE